MTTTVHTAIRRNRVQRWTCDDHSQYTAGCQPCQQRSAARGRQRTRLLAYGKWRGMVDSATARAHAQKLIDASWTGRRIAEAAKLAPSVVHRLLNGDTPEVYADTADAILALPVVPYQPAGQDHVDSTGTARRLRALSALGHSTAKLAAELGVLPQSVTRWRRQYRPSIAVEHRDAVADMYERLSSVPGTCRTAKSEARRHRWAAPLAWEGVDIDDPNTQPITDAPRSGADRYDPITVGLATDGRLTYDQIKSNRADVLETVRRLATRMSDQEIALHLRWPGAEDGPAGKTRGQGAVCQLRIRNGIPNHHAREVIAPTSTRDRARAARRRTKQAA